LNVCVPILLTLSLAAALRPNIIIILVDDAGYDDINGTHSPTPHINSIGNNGVIFSNAYVTAPQCSPSRLALLTGRYQQHFGHETNLEFLVGMSNESTKIIPQFLPHDYATAMIGKWNLGDIPNAPGKHGFNETFLYRHCDEAFARNESLMIGDIPVRGREFSTSLMFSRAEQFIERQVSRTVPFFLYLAPMSPHVPHVYPPWYASVFEAQDPSLPLPRRRVLTMMREIDDGIGRILKSLKDQGVFHDTMIVFVNDNGAPHLGGGSTTTSPNRPFRGFKGDTLEGGVRVRMHVQWTKEILKGQVVNDPVSSLDILPTIVDITRSKQSALSVRDGKSWIEYIRAFQRVPVKSHWDRTLFWRFHMECREEKRAVREGDWKWVWYDQQQSDQQLYNITADVSESRNLAAMYPDIVAEMRTKYERWQAQFPPIPRKPKSQIECQQQHKHHIHHVTVATHNRFHTTMQKGS